MVRTVGKPQRRPWLRRYLTEIRDGLIKDLGPREEDLTTAQRVLVDRIVTLLGLVRLYEENVRAKGLFSEGNPLSELQTLYLSYNEAIRRDLQTLGVGKRREELETAEEIGRRIAKESAARRKSPRDDESVAIGSQGIEEGEVDDKAN